MHSFISVIIPTFNPNRTLLNLTLAALQAQNLPDNRWEVIIVDNNSMPRLEIDNRWPANINLYFEEKQGLTYARVKGVEMSKGDIIVMVDDDNILNYNYLTEVVSILESSPNLAAIGGKIFPQFEAIPKPWVAEFYPNLALRDFGNSVVISHWTNKYPETAPIGAGMAIRKKALKNYIIRSNSGNRTIQDRSGQSLASGGDNDIILTVLKEGWTVGYYPTLALKHVIPQFRMEPAYLARLLHDSNKSWITVLSRHGINPWSEIPHWSVPFRKLKAYFAYKAWKGTANYIKWCGACGYFEGLSSINV